MDLNFDYREFQRDSMERLARIYAESFEDQETQQDVSEADKTFGKIQKILDCREMEKCHPYLFTLDRANVNEDDKKKVDELYECGVKRGFISEEDQDEESLKNECDVDDCCDSALCGGPDDALTDRPMETPPAVQNSPRPSFNVLYSAMKDGDVKLGEFYSLATSNDGAREDCISQLQAAGYSNITIMAIEQNTDAVDQDVAQTPPGENLYGMYEDDSEEYEKQETGDTSSDDSTDDKSDDSSAEDASSEDSSSEETSDDGSEETSGDDSEAAEETPEEGSDEKNKDAEEKTEEKPEGDSDASEEGSEEEKTDDAEDADSGDSEKEPEEEKKLTASEKSALKDEYTKVFKTVLPKVSTEKSFSEMTIAEKTDFLTKLSEKWTKNDPSEFLSDKDQEKLNKVVAKPEEKESK